MIFLGTKPSKTVETIRWNIYRIRGPKDSKFRILHYKYILRRFQSMLKKNYAIICLHCVLFWTKPVIKYIF